TPHRGCGLSNCPREQSLLRNRVLGDRASRSFVSDAGGAVLLSISYTARGRPNVSVEQRIFRKKFCGTATGLSLGSPQEQAAAFGPEPLIGPSIRRRLNHGTGRCSTGKRLSSPAGVAQKRREREKRKGTQREFYPISEKRRE